MKKINFEYNVAFHNMIVHCPDFSEEKLITFLNNFKTVNMGIDNLVGCDYTSPQILFVHNDKLDKVKEILDRIMFNEADDDVFYYLEKKCKNSDYIIMIYDLEYINNSYNYKDFSIMVEQIEQLCDCIIASGANSDDINAFEIIATKLAKQLQEIELPHLPNYQTHEEVLKEFIENGFDESMMINNEDNPDNIVLFYKLLMDNLLYDIIKNIHAQGTSMAIDLYVYEKVKKYLKDK